MRTRLATLAVTCLLLVPMDGRTFAQSKEGKKPPQAGWMTLKSGGRVLRLFETKAGPRMPEIAILQLPQRSYEEFEKDPTTFVKDNNIFPGRKIVKVAHAKDPEDEMKQAVDSDNDTVVVIVHTICKGQYSYLVGASL